MRGGSTTCLRRYRPADDLSGSVKRVGAQVSKGAGALAKPMAAVHEGLVQPSLNFLRRNTVARQLASIAVGIGVTAACGMTTLGTGSVACVSLGMAAGSALDSFLSCPPGRSGGECAAAGAISGFVSGLAFGGAGNVLGSFTGRSLAARVAANAASGAASGAAG